MYFQRNIKPIDIYFQCGRNVKQGISILQWVIIMYIYAFFILIRLGFSYTLEIPFLNINNLVLNIIQGLSNIKFR